MNAVMETYEWWNEWMMKSYFSESDEAGMFIGTDEWLVFEMTVYTARHNAKTLDDDESSE
jgi:hypothetical protein